MGPMPSLTDNDFFKENKMPPYFYVERTGNDYEDWNEKLIARIKNRALQLSMPIPPVLGKPAQPKQIKRKETFRRKR